MANQYRGGRAKGRKNLRRDATGNLVNQYGVTFTEQEKKALESAVNSTNAYRRKMLKEEATLPRMVAGKPTGDTVGSLQLMGKESDFILTKKTKSLQRFKSHDDYDRYLGKLKHINVNKQAYIDERVRMYKRNHMQALQNAFGDSAKDVVMKIRMMKPKDYMQMIQQDESLEISYIYDPTERAGKLNQIRASMGMRLKEDEDYDLDDLLD